MRIISGTHKGKSIVAPKQIKARPTTDFAKESLFNILENKVEIEGLKVLDLFGGTGNISYEFASRGAESVLTVDKSMDSYKFINTFAHENDLPVKCVKSDVFKFLNKPKDSFPLVFADPPYDLRNIKTLPSVIFKNNWVVPNGLLVVEHGRETDFSKEAHYIETRTYSRVNFSFFAINTMTIVTD
jgi:16S rRNA (guanine(966)-N(2))-methyltransferase RsmD